MLKPCNKKQEKGRHTAASNAGIYLDIISVTFQAQCSSLDNWLKCHIIDIQINTCIGTFLLFFIGFWVQHLLYLYSECARPPQTSLNHTPSTEILYYNLFQEMKSRLIIQNRELTRASMQSIPIK